MRKAVFIILLSLVLLFLFIPVGDVLAQGNLPEFKGPIVPETCIGGGPLACGSCELLQLSQNVINFFIFLAVVIAILMFVYAGFLYITAAGSPDKISRAHKIFWTVFIGFIIVLSAWLFVDFLMKTFVGTESEQTQKLGRPWAKILCGPTSGSGGGSFGTGSDDGRDRANRD